MNAPPIVVDGKSFQLPLQVQTIPEEDLIQKLAPHSPDKPLDKGVGTRHKGDGFVFLDLQDPEVCAPEMEPEQRVVISSQVSRMPLAAGVIEHPADGNAVNIRPLNTKSHDPAREDIHDEHHPEAL
jgi:hypothetical protein